MSNVATLYCQVDDGGGGSRIILSCDNYIDQIFWKSVPVCAILQFCCIIIISEISRIPGSLSNTVIYTLLYYKNLLLTICL